MTTVTREDVHDAVEKLPQERLWAAYRALEHLIQEREGALQEECDRRMLQEGLLRRVPSGDETRQARTFQPIRVEGKPVSQTLIEERR